jgi:hypothetical protein
MERSHLIIYRDNIQKIYPKKLNNERRNNPINKWANKLKRQFSREQVQMTNNYI